MLVLDAIAWTLALLLLLPAVVLFVQVMAARRPPRIDEALPDAATRPALAVLMPAHNEAAGIAAPIGAVLAQLRPGDRLLVVADNCSDDTAQVAARLGAEVVERQDADRRGKGYALDHGVRHLRGDPREVVVIVDADCRVEPQALDRLAAACMEAARPVQALYLMRSPPGAGLKTRVAEFAWLLRNKVRPLGCRALGWPCQLMGTGMAFPWSMLARAQLATGHLVEDMQLGLDLAAAGTPPMFCPEALVTSEFPQADAAIAAQRTRWEHGHLGMIASRSLPMLWTALRTGRAGLAAMALDLAVPPLTALTLLLVLALLGMALLAALGGSVGPLGAVSFALALVVAAVAAAWSRDARDIVSPADWLAIPGYILGKLPIYAKLYTARQREWVRTRRRGDSP